ncbi:MAG: helix-turn-helix transcriptional regulator, partial [Bacteroidota bacterium]
GAPPHKWIMERRLLEAYEILKHQPTSVTRVALDLGFKDLPHFSRRFKGRFGVSPSSLLVK